MKSTELSRSHLFKGFLTLIIITLLLSMLSLIVYPQVSDHFNLNKTGFSLEATTDDSGFTVPTIGNSANYYSTKDVINILLAGVDSLQDDDKGYPRADMMAIVSIDTKNNKIKISSLLRDSYVKIEGHGEDKLNEAFVIGGPELLMDTIYNNFGIKLDKYAYLGFDSFINIIDIAGGVEIDLSANEAYTVFEEDTEADKYLLDGTQALNYARIRKLDNDFNRTSRQRKVMLAIFDNLQGLSIVDYISLAYTVYPKVITNLSFKEITQLAQVYFSMENVSMTGMYFPADGTFEETEIDGQAVVEFDADQNRLMLYDFIYYDEMQEQEW